MPDDISPDRVTAIATAARVPLARPGAGSMRLSGISLKVIWEKQRTSTFSHHRRVKRLS
jgi:hypothetical protein